MPLTSGRFTGVAASVAGLPKEPLYATHSGSAEIQLFPEAASSDFDNGEFVILSSGSVTQMATAPAAGAVSASLAAGTLILGMALKSATGTTGTKIPVVIANDDTIFYIPVYAAAAADAQYQDVAYGDNGEVFRYKDAGGSGEMQTVVSAAPNGTDGINKVVIVEKCKTTSATAEYAVVGVKVRSALRSPVV